MKYVQGSEILPGSREEVLPEFAEDFPYIATCAELDKYLEPRVSWHWHKAVELFYVKNGSLEYITPGGRCYFPEGSGGFVNSGVIHSSCWDPSMRGGIQLLHLFEPELLSGRADSRIEQTYIRPLAYESGIELLAFYPDKPEHQGLLEEIRTAFEIPENTFGYELRLRQALSDIWMRILELMRGQTCEVRAGKQSGQQIKQMMIYIHEHYGERISVEQLAKAGHLSKRACFRAFQEYLHMTPVEYIRAYRLQIACQMLVEGKRSITEIAYLCGMGSGSYFGKTFREEKGCTPAEFQRYWHDRDKSKR